MSYNVASNPTPDWNHQASWSAVRTIRSCAVIQVHTTKKTDAGLPNGIFQSSVLEIFIAYGDT